MSLQNVFQWGLLGAVAVIAVMAYSKPAQIVRPLGAAAGPEVTEPTYFRGTVTPGGNVFATTSQGAVTYTAANLLNTSIIQHTASGALTATLPASSTLQAFIPRPGDSRTIYLQPITTLITLAGGTGTDLNVSSTTLRCLAGAVCPMHFVRKSNMDIEVNVTN